MRLARLDLERYGPFTGGVLQFRRGAALHLVHGPNEAGKSSALAAIADLLYGFEARSAADFLHNYADLRVGAEILVPDGGTLAVRRRKGTRNTLTDGAGAPLDDAALEPLLGGVSREVFLTAFGLSQAGLRAGAQALIESRGDIGESLFAAASGLKGLVGVRAGLERDADALFGARKSDKRAFYRAHERYEQARRDVARRALRADELRGLDDEIARREAAAGERAENLGRIVVERARLARLRRTVPLLRHVDAALGEIEALGPLPPLDAAFAARAREACALAASTATELERLERAERTVRETLEALAIDQPALEHAVAIASLNDERAALAKALDDLPRRVGEARSLGQEVADLCRRLGVADRAALEGLLPSDLAIERLRGLAEQRGTLELALTQARKAEQAAGEELARLREAQAGDGSAADPEPLRRTLQALRPALAAAAGALERAVENERRQQTLDERVARLAPAVAEPALWRAPLPDEAAIAGFDERFAAAVERARALGRDGEAIRQRLATAERDLSAPAVRDVVTMETLAAGRARRDGMLDAALAGDAGAVAAYRQAVAATDALADRRFGEADRVLRQEAARQADAEARADLAAHQDLVADHHVDETALRSAWTALFGAFAIEPAPPRAMARWAADVRALREERAAIAAAADAVTAARARIAAERPGLDAVAAQAGIAEPALRTAETLVRETEARLEAMETAARAVRSRTEAAARAEAAHRRASDAAGEAESLLADSDRHWREALAAIGRAEAGLGEVRIALGLWPHAATQLKLLRELDHRIASIEADRRAFDGHAAALALTLEVSADAGPARLAESLAARLLKARDAEARRLATLEQQQQITAESARVRTARDAAGTAIAALAARAGVEADALALVADRLAQRAALAARLASHRSELTQQGDGLSEDDMRAEAAGYEADAAAARDAALTTEAAGLAEEDKDAAADLRDLKRRRAELETASGAATAAEEREAAAAELERIAREYLTLKAASALIAVGVRRQRESEQNPLLTRAGALFARITGGAFAGIGVDYEADDPRLAARRADGRTLGIEGLSEGTRDQLYLALRLASLEVFAGRRPAPPFIADDIVITFDEARVAATLEALAAASQGFQTILFTHHRHVADIAKQRLGERLDLIPLGNG